MGGWGSWPEYAEKNLIEESKTFEKIENDENPKNTLK
jgi:hypothetical protein